MVDFCSIAIEGESPSIKSTSGFDVTFYNSSNSAISRTFDYQAKGYGYLESS